MNEEQLKKLISEYGGLMIDDEYGRANQTRDFILAEWERMQAQNARMREALEQVYDMFHNDPQLALVQWDIVSVVRDTLAEDDQEYLSAMKNSKMIDDYFKDGEP